ncbi:MAG: GGDEF domain-containing protein [Acidimicrobiales bacterium]
MSSKNGSAAESMRHESDDDAESQATLTSIHAGESIATFSSEGYEPWLFQTMLNELSERELGVGFIYSILELFATRHGLSDVAVVLVNDSFGTQMFRLGGEAVTPDMAAHLNASPGVYCEPDTVPAAECDAIRTACQLAMSLHLARFSAAHDPLTNISNRRSFDEALEVAAARSARYGWAFTLVLVDLNNFKAVNDKSGHEFGNHLLRQFGFALRQAVRQGDTAARIGGDEFAVILSNAEGHESSGFTERLRGHLVALGNPVEFTIGTATSPRDSTDPGELLRMADGRLYEKKGIRIS